VKQFLGTPKTPTDLPSKTAAYWFLSIIFLHYFLMKLGFSEKVAGFLRKKRLLVSGEKVLVACSGGPDSVALHFALKELSRRFRLKLGIAHLNHQLRSEAGKDAEFVQKLAARLRLPFFCSEVDVKTVAKESKWSLEEAGRNMRYQFFEQIARDEKFDKIATAHTADDVAETVLLQIIRGTGGPVGIPASRGKITRPLLSCTRQEVMAYLKEKKLRYRIDPSNTDIKFLRNRIRHQLLPLLEKDYNPQIRLALIRLAEISAGERGFIEKEAQTIAKKAAAKDGDAFGLKTTVLKNAPKAVQREVLQLTCSQNFGFSPDFEATERLLRLFEKPGKIELAKNLYAQSIQAGILWFYRKQEKKKPHGFVLPTNGMKRVDGLIFSARTLPRTKIRSLILPNDWEGYFDADQLRPPFVLRPVDNGDRFIPLGMKGSKKVGDFLTDAKVPAFLRQNVLVLTSAGKICWLVGHRISEEFKVRSNTITVLHLKASPDG